MTVLGEGGSRDSESLRATRTSWPSVHLRAKESDFLVLYLRLEREKKNLSETAHLVATGG